MPDGLTGLTLTGGGPIAPPGAAQAATGTPVGGAASTFNIGGAPIAILGGVLSGGLPLGGPVTQVFRGGSAPMPPTLPLATLTAAGPIGSFLLGASGGPIGVEVFAGGGLPIGPAPQVEEAIVSLGARTAAVTVIAVGFPGSAVTGPALPIDGSAMGRSTF
ncbi:MAG TPA: hypothetical protein VGK74_07645 [Symbiobacteriaceae bacterium]|jgi:hypothetical protein